MELLRTKLLSNRRYRIISGPVRVSSAETLMIHWGGSILQRCHYGDDTKRRQIAHPKLPPPPNRSLTYRYRRIELKTVHFLFQEMSRRKLMYRHLWLGEKEKFYMNLCLWVATDDRIPITWQPARAGCFHTQCTNSGFSSELVALLICILLNVLACFLRL